MDLETYKRKLLEDDERKNLAELQKKYSGKETPNYADMSLREELETRFDLNELNDLQQKYGEQQTQTTSTPYNQPSAPQQPNTQPSTWDNTIRKAIHLVLISLNRFSLF